MRPDASRVLPCPASAASVQPSWILARGIVNETHIRDRIARRPRHPPACPPPALPSRWPGCRGLSTRPRRRKAGGPAPSRAPALSHERPLGRLLAAAAVEHPGEPLAGAAPLGAALRLADRLADRLAGRLADRNAHGHLAGDLGGHAVRLHVAGRVRHLADALLGHHLSGHGGDLAGLLLWLPPAPRPPHHP